MEQTRKSAAEAARQYWKCRRSGQVQRERSSAIDCPGAENAGGNVRHFIPAQDPEI
jgi:hypothetical protein